MIIAVAIIAALAAICLIYLFLISPRVADRADMDLLLVDYAHRGLWSADIPENSLAAFARAAERGFGIELDIRLTKDKRIVVFHDDDLVRMCGINKKVSELTYDELRGITLRGSRYTIPLFSEVLRVVDGRVPLLVELKGENGNTELCGRAADVLDKYHGAFCIESFNPLLLRWFKKYRPRYARGQLVTKLTRKDKKASGVISFCLSHLLLNFLSRPDFIAVDGRIRRTPKISICKRLFGTKLFVWTVRNDREYNVCRNEGSRTIFEKFIP